ncbi:MAG: hypothetical protein AAF206_11410 [Bacteroidota bacterium]
MKRFLIILGLSLPFFLFAQDNTFTLNTSISLEMDESMPDSVKEKIQFITTEMDVFSTVIMSMVSSMNINVPPKASSEEVQANFNDILSRSLGQFMQENQEFNVNLVKHFLNNYSMAELKELDALYQTSLGQKLLQSNVFLNNQISEGSRAMQEIQDAIIEAEYGKGKKKKKKK